MTARNSGKKWTKSDIEKLRRLARQKVDTDDIAKKLERTTDAIYTEASKKHISLMPKDKK